MLGFSAGRGQWYFINTLMHHLPPPLLLPPSPGVPSPPSPLTLLIIILDICNLGPAANSSALHQLLFQGPDSLASYYQSISFGHTYLDPGPSSSSLGSSRATAVVNVVLPCSGSVGVDVCDVGGWQQAAEGVVAGLGYDIRSYTARVSGKRGEEGRTGEARWAGRGEARGGGGKAGRRVGHGRGKGGRGGRGKGGRREGGEAGRARKGERRAGRARQGGEAGGGGGG